MSDSGFEPGTLYLQSVTKLTMIDFHTEVDFYTYNVKKKLIMERNNIYIIYYHYSSKYKIRAEIDNNN